MQLVRSIIFVPGIQERFLERATGIPADAVCLDLEDSVAPADKARAREMVREWIPKVALPRYSLIVRVNGFHTGLLEDDLLAVIRPELAGISLPKADSVDVVQRVDHYLTLLEKERGIPNGQIKIIPWLESPEAIANAPAICRASTRLFGASFGGEDFSIGMNFNRTKSAREVEWPRYQVAVACRAAGIQPIDTPYMDFRDTEGLQQEAQYVRSIGYSGKYCIHPSQVETVNKAFMPSEQEIARAKRIIEFYKEAESKGAGAISMDGFVVDRPVYVRALAVLEQAGHAPEEA